MNIAPNKQRNKIYKKCDGIRYHEITFQYLAIKQKFSRLDLSAIQS